MKVTFHAPVYPLSFSGILKDFATSTKIDSAVKYPQQGCMRFDIREAMISNTPTITVQRKF
jgi:hypothetical protein